MTHPPPGAPRPLSNNVGLLDAETASLESTDLLTEDAVPSMREALGKVRELMRALHDFDGNAYPARFKEQLERVELALVTRSGREALNGLRAAREDLEAYWRH